MKKSFIVCIIVMLWSSCTLLFEEPTPSLDDPRIINKANQRIQQYVNGKKSSCFNRISAEAESYVDSIITVRINQFLTDTVYFPPKPPRPDLPDKLEVDTSLIPTPIFKDSLPVKLLIQKDTSQRLTDTLTIDTSVHKISLKSTPSFNSFWFTE